MNQAPERPQDAQSAAHAAAPGEAQAPGAPKRFRVWKLLGVLVLVNVVLAAIAALVNIIVLA
ncbi:MAG TPA: hypothetical protein VLA56_01035 [Pseudomonadales bacterium]|nr:hypothetical protein [Pseudomonadales bacterium]